MKTAQTYIGTSGWKYKHWKGTFYPPGLKDADEFEYYCRHFNTVEINNSFYRLPPPDIFGGWKKRAPVSFLFAVKAPRFITHMKKLIIDKEGLKGFLSSAANLKSKEGPLLFQLPPRWKKNASRLEDFLKVLPKKLRVVFEFRDQSWYSEDIYKMLEHYGAAFCIYDLARHQSPMQVTANFVYVRLHGPGDKYRGSYPRRDLLAWAKRCHGWLADGKDVYIYFDNDEAGFAAFNAAELKYILNKVK